jgi:serine/threonine-protein kinase HipA
MSEKANQLEVWVDCDICPMQLLGILSHDRGVVRFEYHDQWLRNKLAFEIDPELALGSGSFYPKPEMGNFGIFMDSSPDRWGQTLMRRRELLQAKDAGLKPRTLYAWDYLQGVQDITRQGALRFKPVGAEQFVAHDALAAPPVTNLAELAEVAKSLTNNQIDDLDQIRRWLSVLVAPGASLGGARPKANFSENDGSYWIAKFPAHQDTRDIGAWDGVARTLASNAKIDMPPYKTIKLSSSGYTTFCVKRFDRIDGVRKFYASAMTLLRKPDNTEGTSSYLELAQFLSIKGDPNTLGSDLKQLFRRVAFNVAIGNRDDHLRNHGFILNKHGWQLSPAFDINPNIDKNEHVLNIDESDNRPSLETVINTAAFYRLGNVEANEIVNEVVSAVDQWKSIAKKAGLSSESIFETEEAFSAHTEYRSLNQK